MTTTEVPVEPAAVSSPRAPTASEPSHALLLFAPKFREFGLDVARELIRRKFADTIDGICTGGVPVAEAVRVGLGDSGGEIIDIEAEEATWFDARVSRKDLVKLNELPVGAVGRIISSDRRVGSGLVTSARTRPSLLKRQALKKPSEFPTVYAACLIGRLRELLERTRPKAIFLYAHAGSISAGIVELAISLSIPVYRMIPARVGRRFLIDDGPLGVFGVVQRFRETPALVSAQHRTAAADELKAFRKRPEAPDYVKHNARQRSKTRLLPLTARALAATLRNGVPWLASKSLPHLIKIQRPWFDLANAARDRFSSGRLFSEDIPADRTLVYFPLHVAPESSTMVLAPYHSNQFAIVEALARALPPDAVLLVKEHLPMKGLRPRGFYEAIASLPRVVLLPPHVGGLWCVQKADLTAVITGTAAWEAVRLGKPALVIGDLPFLQLGEGFVHEPCLAKLPEALDRALRLPPARDRVLIDFLAALHAASFEMDTSVLWGDYMKHRGEVRVAATRNIVEGILRAHSFRYPADQVRHPPRADE